VTEKNPQALRDLPGNTCAVRVNLSILALYVLALVVLT
jgi:hypothetical protein